MAGADAVVREVKCDARERTAAGWADPVGGNDLLTKCYFFIYISGILGADGDENLKF
jgi:hypothetical protein